MLIENLFFCVASVIGIYFMGLDVEFRELGELCIDENLFRIGRRNGFSSAVSNIGQTMAMK